MLQWLRRRTHESRQQRAKSVALRCDCCATIVVEDGFAFLSPSPRPGNVFVPGAPPFLLLAIGEASTKTTHTHTRVCMCARVNTKCWMMCSRLHGEQTLEGNAGPPERSEPGNTASRNRMHSVPGKGWYVHSGYPAGFYWPARAIDCNCISIAANSCSAHRESQCAPALKTNLIGSPCWGLQKGCLLYRASRIASRCAGILSPESLIRCVRQLREAFEAQGGIEVTSVSYEMVRTICYGQTQSDRQRPVGR